jgi:FkbM family methyltransferase
MNQILKDIIDHSKPRQEADFLKSIFGRFRDDAVSGKTPVVLFGAGAAGQGLYPNMTFHGIHPVCFCDNNLSLSGSSRCGIPVISFEELIQKHKASLIVVTTNTHSKEITNQLLASGFSADNILYVGGDRLFYYHRFYNYHLQMSDLQEDAQIIQDAYNLLSDQKSRDLFVNRMAMFASGADYSTLQQFVNDFSDIIPSGTDEPGCTENYLYFKNDIISIHDDEVLVDAGAFTGDSVDEFVKMCEKLHVRYKSIYCFEPDLDNFEKLQKNTSKFRNVECFQLGLWSHPTTIHFASSAQIASYAARIIREPGDMEIIIPTVGDVEIKTTSIDEQFGDNDITFIKMDIEGSEIEALHGSANTIRKNKPTLVISAYHKKDDLYRITTLIHQICPEYKLYLRHFGTSFCDTVIIATL